MKSFIVRVKFPWWKDGKRAADRYGKVIGKIGAEYIIKPQDTPNKKIRLYMNEFEITCLKKYK